MSTYTTATRTGFQMPALAYPAGALAPIISQATIECHYGKHLQTYVDNLNKLIGGTDYEKYTLREIVEQAPPGPLFNNAGQVLNHSLYFEQFTPAAPGNNRPTGNLKEFIHFVTEQEGLCFDAGQLYAKFKALGKEKMEMITSGKCMTVFLSGEIDHSLGRSGLTHVSLLPTSRFECFLEVHHGKRSFASTCYAQFFILHS